MALHRHTRFKRGRDIISVEIGIYNGPMISIDSVCLIQYFVRGAKFCIGKKLLYRSIHHKSDCAWYIAYFGWLIEFFYIPKSPQ